MDTKSIRDIPFPSVSVCRSLSWKWPSIGTYLHKVDVDGSMALEALAKGHLNYFDKYIKNNKDQCQMLIRNMEKTKMINEFDCQKEITKKVREWFKKDLTYQNVIERNCTSNSVMQWCKNCWEMKNECYNCSSDNATKSNLIDICTLVNKQPSNWQNIDIFLSEVASNPDKFWNKKNMQMFAEIAEETNQVNILALWKILNSPLSDTLNATESKILLDTLAKNEENGILESLQSPKIHGDYEKEYVLVPYCSFGNTKLKKCDLFKRVQNFYRDDQLCYTFNQDGNYSGHSLHPLSGLNFVLNYRVPGKELYTNVIIHSFNEVPYIDHLPATSYKIKKRDGRGWSFEIGTEASITNISSNFANMKASKRNCYPNVGRNRFYSRTKCMMQKAIELAAKTCQCLPWFIMQNLTLQSAVCDPIGLNCFDNLTVNYLDSNVNNECPQECVTTEYSTIYDEKGWNDRNIPQDTFGEKWTKYLEENNPMYYADSSGPYLHTMVHVNFIRKNANVILKDARVTFSDMLGTIGGTFGVFIGLSFVGVLDFFIWIWNWIKQMRLLKTTSIPRRK